MPKKVAVVKPTEVTISQHQDLYIIPCGDGYTCLGFDVLIRRATALANELGLPFNEKRGTLQAYQRYTELIRIATAKHNQTGWRSESQLHPQLIGLEHKRVRVTDADDLSYSFTVGKSTGVVPCHLQLRTKDSGEGPAVDSRPFKKVEVDGCQRLNR